HHEVRRVEVVHPRVVGEHVETSEAVHGQRRRIAVALAAVVGDVWVGIGGARVYDGRNDEREQRGPASHAHPNARRRVSVEDGQAFFASGVASSAISTCTTAYAPGLACSEPLT